MKISKLNEAVIVQFAGFMLLMALTEPWLRIAGIVIIIIGGIMYRRERKRLKILAASAETSSEKGS